MLLLVREHGHISLTLDLTLATHDTAETDRPGFPLLELVTGALAQFVFGEPQGLLVIQPLPAHSLPADVRNWQH